MPGALDGIRVIDFGQYIAGPLRGDAARRPGRRRDPRRPARRSAVGHARQRDLEPRQAQHRARPQARRTTATSPSGCIADGRRRDRELPSRRDGPPRARRWRGVTAANPRLIYCSLPGFAADDPRAAHAGVGGRRRRGDRHLPRGPRRRGATPLFTAIPIASTFAAFLGAVSIVMALLLARARRPRPAHRGAAVRRDVRRDRRERAVGQDGKRVGRAAGRLRWRHLPVRRRPLGAARAGEAAASRCASRRRRASATASTSSALGDRPRGARARSRRDAAAICCARAPPTSGRHSARRPTCR